MIREIDVERLEKYKEYRVYLYDTIDKLENMLSEYTSDAYTFSPDELFDFFTTKIFPAIDFTEDEEWTIFERFWYCMREYGNKDILNKSLVLEKDYSFYFYERSQYVFFSYSYICALIFMNYRLKNDPNNSFEEIEWKIIKIFMNFNFSKQKQIKRILYNKVRSLTNKEDGKEIGEYLEKLIIRL